VHRPGTKQGLLLGYLLVGLVAALAGFSIFQMSGPGGPSGVAPSTSATRIEDRQLIGMQRPEFSLPDASGTPTSISHWDGDVLLVNFWATWCAPCREEMPWFAELQDQYGQRGFQVVGVAIDQPEAVAEFTARIGVDYPQLIGPEEAIEVAERYGNAYGALPYSVLIDRAGIVRFIKAGALEKQELEAELLPLLKESS
jgi:peroxiredoxin